jgi:hypothetical protein
MLLFALAQSHGSTHWLETTLTWYHIIPLSLASFLWLTLFGHGTPDAGPLWLWHTIWFLLIYIGQVLLTALFALLVASRFRHSDEYQKDAHSLPPSV